MKCFQAKVIHSSFICVNRTVGEILAVSLAQGGPAPAFFSPWTYSYLCSGQINPTTLNRDSVADVQLQGLLDQVRPLYDGNAGFIKNTLSKNIFMYLHGKEIFFLFFYFQVEMSTEHSIEGLSDEILNCGYTGAISVQNKESIVRYARTYVCLYSKIHYK